MKSELKKRILSTFILLTVVLVVITQGLIILNLFLLACFFIALFEWHRMSNNRKYFYPGIIFLILSFFTVFKLSNTNNYYLYFLIILLICISTDLGGYIFGRLLKGPKLTRISPKKTFSGLFGGIFLSLLSVSYFLKIDYLIIETEISFKLLILVTSISIVSQIGDIIISYFKRLSKIKDTGSIIPGHGGILDRIDGMLFAFPFSYVILLINFSKIL
tara:strand:+ start:2280 stop:2930 length:651 start_codon:yes stop_codon:yes gene_type:complete